MLLTKGITAAALLLGTTLGAGLVADPTTPSDTTPVSVLVPVPDEDSDPRRDFDGDWNALNLEDKGQNMPFAELRGLQFHILDGKITIRRPKGAFDFGFEGCSFDIDPKASPQEIDLTILDGPEKGRVLRGIYQVRNDVLKLAFRMPGHVQLGRPRGYSTVSGTLISIDLEREKKKQP